MKNIYLISIKLFSLHILFAGALIGAYNLLVKQIFNVEKLFDVLLITTIFNVIALIVSFVFAVKIVGKKNNELFESRHRLALFFYVLNVFLFILLIFIFLMMSKVLTASIFLLGSCLVLLYIYYYFLRLVYYISFFNKLRKTAIVFVVILAVGYSLVLFLPQSNYKKAYGQTEVKVDFTYFHNLDLDGIVGNMDLKDKNSAKEMSELINLIATDEKLLNEGEKLSYILPTEIELELLSDMANNKYLSFSQEYLSKEMRITGIMIAVPLNDLRAFSRGAVKLAERKRTEGFEDEAVGILNNLLLVGNQMLNAKNDTLVTKLVGESMMHDGLDGLLQIYENDDLKIEIIADLDNELNNMRNGCRLLQTAVFHMNNAIVGSSKNTAVFFKHFAAQKHNIGSDFDERMVVNNSSLIGGYITINTTDLEKLLFSIMTLPIRLPFDLNIGNNYIIYKEIKKLSQESGHELLNFYFDNTYSDFIRAREEGTEKAGFIYVEIFSNNISSGVASCTKFDPENKVLINKKGKSILLAIINIAWLV